MGNRSPDGSKKFSSAFPAKEPSSSPFQLQWPSFHPPSRTFLTNQSAKDLENRLFREAKEKALDAEKEAYEKGFAQGEKDGVELGCRRFEAHLQAFQKILEEVQRYQREFHRKHEQEMVKFLLTVVGKILHQEIPHAEEVITATLREAFQYVEERKKIRVHLHPKDYEFLTAHPDRLPFSLNGENPEGIRLVANSSLLRGGCLLETAFGDIDATIESQLDRVTTGIWQKINSCENTPFGSNP
jgi:flagellar assembly protein FliH